MLGHKPNKLLYLLLPLFAFLIFWAISTGKPKPKPGKVFTPPTPIVKALDVSPSEHYVWIKTQGVIEPSTRIHLVSQVNGNVLRIADNFVNGQPFNQGDTLIWVDPSDYEIALKQAEATLINAKSALAVEEGSSRQAKREWRDLGSKKANELFLRKPQLASAQAEVKAAEANLAKARLDLERTKVKAPFSGRVISKNVDRGQFITSGTAVAEIFNNDSAELILPLSMKQYAQIDQSGREVSVDVVVRMDANDYVWKAKLARIEAEIDSQTRQHLVVAKIDSAFEGSIEKPALSVGQFVTANIRGRQFKRALDIPANTLRQPSRLWLIDSNSKLHIVDVKVLQSGSDNVLVQLPEGIDKKYFVSNTTDTFLRIVTSDLSLPIPGMLVELQQDKATLQAKDTRLEDSQRSSIQ